MLVFDFVWSAVGDPNVSRPFLGTPVAGDRGYKGQAPKAPHVQFCCWV